MHVSDDFDTDTEVFRLRQLHTLSWRFFFLSVWRP